MDNDVISRREFGTVTAGASIGLLAPTLSQAATVGSGVPVNYSRGLIESPPTYYEVLEPIGGSKKPPLVLIPGGAHTGTCYLAASDGVLVGRMLCPRRLQGRSARLARHRA